ncbi:hypothetical protein QR98_0066700 [Sarcoptes scabiei]|uniref:Uncharacterized protein n=1 Tax=Sarcoptes scabiei TaxID=52283 RepID=A0A132AAZ7_SARSC|nr:hypothetical protein QR98_0066700 [Sarcoptes scabiei]
MLNLFLSFTLQPVNAVRLIIEGDNKTFTNVDSLFEFRLINEYFIPFSYKFIIEIPSYLHEEYYTQNYFYYWNHNFTNIKPGSYSLHVEVYIYPIFNNVFGWKVADAQVPLEIRVGPTPSFAFVVIPLISLMLVTIITLIGIIHCIRQRKKMNATIEVATIENFGIFENEDETLLIEKTFFRRIKDSFKEAF